jgi:hypothetical protein
MARSLGRYLPEKLRLRITLAGSKPKVWRQVEVDSGLTLDELHYVIQNVFDWEEAHLYQFLVPPGGKLTMKAMGDAKRYDTLPPDPIFDDGDSERADEAMIGRIFTDKIKQIIYEYDFGDSWQHIVKLEKRSPWEDVPQPPRCIAGENAAPPEDVGGIWGYYDWVNALADPKHELHEEAEEVLGEDFDLSRFDLDEVNRRLARAFQPVKPRPKRPKKKK